MNIAQIQGAPAHYLHRDLSTQNQVGVLLSVLQVAGGLLTDKSHDPHQTSEELPEQAKLAAEATFLRACDKLDGILEDPRRWGIDFQLALEKQFTEAHSQQMATMKEEQAKAAAQREAAEEIKSPHFRYKPVLFKTDDGQWIALIGDPEKASDGILGVGDSPADALREFDQVFAGNLSNQAKKLAAMRERQLEQEANEATLEALEHPGNPTTDDPPQRGEDGSGNIGPAKSDL